MKDKSNPRRSAFTLVEILVVAVIISILLSLVSAAVFRAIRTAKETGIATEASGLTQGMLTLVQENMSGGYPPTDLSDPDQATSQIVKYVRKVFPRYNVANLKAHLDAEGIQYATFDPGYSLVFWLVGFSGDPANPFRGHQKRMLGLELDKSLYEFVPERLIDGRYFPKLDRIYSDDNDNGQWDSGEAYDPQRAFLYFDSQGYAGLDDATSIRWLPPSATDTFLPYRKLATVQALIEKDRHYNNDKCQIVSAGMDGKLGVGGRPPADGEPYFGDDADNITNFTEGGTMEDFTDK